MAGSASMRSGRLVRVDLLQRAAHLFADDAQVRIPFDAAIVFSGDEHEADVATHVPPPAGRPPMRPIFFILWPDEDDAATETLWNVTIHRLDIGIFLDPV